MGLNPFAGGRGRFVTAMVLTLGPGLGLSYVGLTSVAGREDAIRVNYTATSVLIRDRVLVEWAALESAFGQELSRLPAAAAPLEAFQAWLARAGAERAPDTQPFLIRADGAVTTATLASGWSHVPWVEAPESVARSIATEAARAEARGDLAAALGQYQSALRQAASSGERAAAQARVGRVLFKLTRVDDGLAAYRDLSRVDASLHDGHGIPYAAMARAQIVEGLEAHGQRDESRRAAGDLLRWLLANPWDADQGYGFYLDRARKAAASLDADLEAQAAGVADRLADLGWLRSQLQPRLAGRPPAPDDTSSVRVTGTRGERVLLASARPAPSTSAGQALWVGVMVSTSDIADLLLRPVLSGVELGADVSVALLDAAGRNPRTGVSASPLGSADLGDLLPGWRVAVLDAEGRTLQQVGGRERWVYGALVAGAMSLMLVGVVLAARAWTREAELARLRADFVSNVSHELKTPLALIRMFGETLESGLVADPGRAREFHGIIRRESERLTHLINNVLDAAKIDAGNKRFVLSSGDLVSLVEETLDAYRPLLTRLGFGTAVTLPPGAVVIDMDRDAVAQALVNLFQNVIKYSDATKHVSVSLVEDGREVRLAVADRGIGIAPHELPRIFDTYYRVASGDAAGSAGSGLGLAIVKHTMTAHHGRVDVTSTPGEGSTFTLVFPRPDGEVVASTSRESASTPIQGGAAL